MCAVHDDGGNDVVHVGNVSEVYHEIVIPEAVASFGEPYVVCSGVSSFFYGVSHVVCAEELCLFDVDRFPGLCGGDEQIGLPTQKGGYLDELIEVRLALSKEALKRMSMPRWVLI